MTAAVLAKRAVTVTYRHDPDHSSHSLYTCIRELADKMPHSAHNILYALATHANYDGTNCSPGRAKLMADSNYKKDTVGRAMKYLTRHGFLLRDGYDRYGNYRYRLNLPGHWMYNPDWNLPAAPAGADDLAPEPEDLAAIFAPQAEPEPQLQAEPEPQLDEERVLYLLTLMARERQLLKHRETASTGFTRMALALHFQAEEVAFLWKYQLSLRSRYRLWQIGLEAWKAEVKEWKRRRELATHPPPELPS